ncbi:MAG: hypothetical protein LAT82_00245 [Nanoarchaeota archaeon]|nr:hypothetical protein [Nanoarchaeota archaeon]
MVGDQNFLFFVMFWTIIAMMLVLIYSLKQIIITQKYMQNIDRNIEKMVKQTLAEEERILHDLEEIEDEMHLKKSSAKKSTKKK